MGFSKKDRPDLYERKPDASGKMNYFRKDDAPDSEATNRMKKNLEDIRKQESGADVDRRKAQEFVDAFVDSVDADHADQFLHFTRLGDDGQMDFIRFSDFADKYAENKEDLYMVADFSHHGNNSLADAANSYVLETMFDDREEQFQWRVDIENGEMTIPVENLFDDDFSEKVLDIQDAVSWAGIEGSPLNEDVYEDHLYDVGRRIAPEGSSRLEDIKDGLADSLVEEYGDVRDEIDTVVNQGSMRRAFMDMMADGSIDPTDVDYDRSMDDFEISDDVIPEIAQRAWVDNRE